MTSIHSLSSSENSIQWTDFEDSSVNSQDEFARSLFTIEASELSSMLEPLFAEANQSGLYSPFIDLVRQVIQVGADDNEKTEVVLGAMAEKDQFYHILLKILPDHKLFIYTLLSLSWDQGNYWLNQILSVPENLNFTECLKSFIEDCNLTLDQKRTLFDQLLYLLNEDEFEKQTQLVVTNTSIQDLGKLFSLTDSKETAKEFVRIFRDVKSTNENYHEQLLQLLSSIILEAENTPPQILRTLLKTYQTVTVILRHLNELETDDITYTLWCLPNTRRVKFFRELAKKGDFLAINDHLKNIFELEESFQNRVKFLRAVVNDLDEEGFDVFLNQLAFLSSSCIPHLYLAMDDERIFYFTYSVSPLLRAQLLKNSLAADEEINRKNITSLQNRFQYFLNMTLDFPSQSYTQNSEGEAIAMMSSLKEVSENIQKAIDDGTLESYLANYKEDLNKVPPFLIAIAMADDNLRPLYLQIIRFLSDEQITAFAELVPEEDADKIINLMMTNVIQEQLPIVLKALPVKQRSSYIITKTHEGRKCFKEIETNQTNLKTAYKTLEKNPDKEAFETFLNQCTRQSILLKKVLTPQSQAIVSFLNECFYDVPPKKDSLIVIVENCRAYQKELSEYVKTIKTLKKEQEYDSAQESSDSEQSKRRKRSNSVLEKFKLFGISSYNDYKYLGINRTKLSLTDEEKSILSNYLKQPNLKEKWEKLRKTQLPSISDLFELCLIEDSSELFNLDTLIEKLNINDSESNT